MKIFGTPIDDETRCIHYSTAADVVAIKFVCCERFYPCHLCHEQSADHEAQQWPVDRQHEQAILCGVCQQLVSIECYLGVTECPHCSAPFNEGCRLHKHLYFE